NLLGYVHLDGLTIEQSQALLEQKFVEGGFLKNPHVTIMVAEYASGVSLIGEVSRPGIYPVLGTRRLKDIIAAAGGPTPTAGRTVVITHRDDPMNPETLVMDPDPKLAAKANVVVQQGDTIEVLKAPLVYVVGEVEHASGLMLDSGKELSVLKAL